MQIGAVRRVLAAGVLVAAAAPAVAGADPVDRVDCDQHPHTAQCQLTAPPPAPSRAGGEPGEGKGCRYPDGSPAPCRNTHGGQLGGDGCFYQPSPFTRRGPHGQRPPGPGRGRWFIRSGDPRWCGGDSRWVWIPSSHVTAAGLARLAVRRLRLPAPRLRVNPPRPDGQVVGVATWMWLDRTRWVPRSATASLPGLSVTATARPAGLVIITGDGSRVACRGPGSVWRPGGFAGSPSPTCGHVYTAPATTGSR